MSKHLAQAQAHAMPRRRALAALGLAQPPWGWASVACLRPRKLRAGSKLALAQSLPAELAAALAHKQPCWSWSVWRAAVLIPVRDSYLGPLRDEQGQRMVQVDAAQQRACGALLTGSAARTTVDRAWAISIAPTLLFWPAGRELAPRLLGSTLLTL